MLRGLLRFAGGEGLDVDVGIVNAFCIPGYRIMPFCVKALAAISPTWVPYYGLSKRYGKEASML